MLLEDEDLRQAADHPILAWVQERGHEEAGAVRAYDVDDQRQGDVSVLRTAGLLPIASPR